MKFESSLLYSTVSGSVWEWEQQPCIYEAMYLGQDTFVRTFVMIKYMGEILYEYVCFTWKMRLKTRTTSSEKKNRIQ